MNHILDSHFHISYLKDCSADIESACNSICTGIDVGTVFDDLPERSDLLKKQKHIYLSAAMGPWETENTAIEELDRKFKILEKNIEQYKPRFIGEAGLDNFCGYGSREIQEYLFIKNLKLAEQLDKSIIIHNRESDDQMVRILNEFSPSKAGIIHCFSGNIDVMKTALDHGFYISYAGNVTFKKNQYLRDTIKYVPSDRLLLETDAPYLTPVPKRGEKNTPQFIIYTYNCVAEVLSVPVEELIETVYKNFTGFVSLSGNV